MKMQSSKMAFDVTFYYEMELFSSYCMTENPAFSAACD